MVRFSVGESTTREAAIKGNRGEKGLDLHGLTPTKSGHQRPDLDLTGVERGQIST